MKEEAANKYWEANQEVCYWEQRDEEQALISAEYADECWRMFCSLFDSEDLARKYYIGEIAK